MKLELKHIVGYLPYKINCMAQGEGKKIFQIQGITDFTDVDLHEIGRTVNEQYDLEDIFPILRPLSDLTKEIEINGETFVPIEELRRIDEKICFSDDRFMDYDDGKNKNTLHFSFYDIFSYSLGFDEISDIIEKLDEWHFDWRYDLIKNGLAIDINTL